MIFGFFDPTLRTGSVRPSRVCATATMASNSATGHTTAGWLIWPLADTVERHGYVRPLLEHNCVKVSAPTG